MDKKANENGIFIDNKVYKVMEDLILSLVGEGYRPRHLELIKETALVVESLRSLIYKANDVKHPLQQFAANLFKVYTKH